ncbi:DUF2608 domain-containing protein [Chlamydiota bacterium]
MRIFLVLFLLCVRCWGGIVQVHSLDEVREHFKNADGLTYGVFDIDMVLIQPDDPAFQMANIERYYPSAKQIVLSVPPEKRDILYTLTSLHFDSVLVDVELPLFFKELSQRGIPAFALTASLTGSLLHVPDLEAWKNNHLRGWDICFKEWAPHQAPMVLSELPSYRGSHPAFCEGVLSTNGGLCSKGRVLVVFLQHAQLNPRAIIFTDDKEENLKSVEQALLEYDPRIKFVGLHYLGARYYPTRPMSEEAFVASWQALATQALGLN